jgi:hypothetical protein
MVEEFNEGLERFVETYVDTVKMVGMDIYDIEEESVEVKDETMTPPLPPCPSKDFPSLKEIMIRYYSQRFIKLGKIPLDLKNMVLQRRYAYCLCDLFNPFISESCFVALRKLKTPKYDKSSALHFISDVQQERVYTDKLFEFGLDLFGVRDAWYDHDMRDELHKLTVKKNIFDYVYYKYHLAERPICKQGVELKPRKRDPNFDIKNVNLELYLRLEESLVEMMDMFEIVVEND